MSEKGRAPSPESPTPIRNSKSFSGRTLFVGDTIKADIESQKLWVLRVIQWRRNENSLEKLLPDYTIKSFSGLQFDLKVLIQGSVLVFRIPKLGDIICKRAWCL